MMNVNKENTQKMIIKLWGMEDLNFNLQNLSIYSINRIEVDINEIKKI